MLFALVTAVSEWVAACQGHGTAAPLEPLRVAAAADLTFAMDVVAKDFTAKTGRKVTVTYGASGLLAKQISNGAPFDLFASASPEFSAAVVRDHHCAEGSERVYAHGHLSLVPRKGLGPVGALGELRDATWTRIAIANPDHAPYGAAAKRALMSAGIWETVKERIVFGGNVQQTLSFVETGNADVAIVASSLASNAADVGRIASVDPVLYSPIAQTLVVCNGAHTAPDEASRQFASYVLSPEGQRTLRLHGFGPADATDSSPPSNAKAAE